LGSRKERIVREAIAEATGPSGLRDYVIAIPVLLVFGLIIGFPGVDAVGYFIHHPTWPWQWLDHWGGDSSYSDGESPCDYSRCY
jgi:hypothetical protein